MTEAADKMAQALREIAEQHGHWNNGIWVAGLARKALAAYEQEQKRQAALLALTRENERLGLYEAETPGNPLPKRIEAANARLQALLKDAELDYVQEDVPQPFFGPYRAGVGFHDGLFVAVDDANGQRVAEIYDIESGAALVRRLNLSHEAEQAAARQLVSASSIDVERMISQCLPGGSICDPQQVADAIRAYCKAWPERAAAAPDLHKLADRAIVLARQDAAHPTPEAMEAASKARTELIRALGQAAAPKAEAVAVEPPVAKDDAFVKLGVMYMQLGLPKLSGAEWVAWCAAWFGPDADEVYIARAVSELLAAPQPATSEREPLTEEQIARLYREQTVYQDGVTPSGLVRITRYIEQAHGITRQSGNHATAKASAITSENGNQSNQEPTK